LQGVLTVPAVTTRPNLFAYATSELSQDAFLCWLIAHVQHPEAGALHRCARDFVAFMHNRYHRDFPATAGGPADVSADHVSEVTVLNRQKNHTDISFKATIAGKTITFVIEDKLDTTHGNNQLERYRLTLDHDGVAADARVLVYLKTGYMMPDDLRATAHGWTVIGPDDMLAFFDRHDTGSEILRDFHAHLQSKQGELKEHTAALFEKNDLSTLDKRNPEQANLMKSLQVNLINALMEGLEEHHAINEVHSTQNRRNGAPYTQFKFISQDVCGAEAVDEVLYREEVFYRIDNNKKNPENASTNLYIGARQYARVENSPSARQRKVERLKRYCSAFESAMAKVPGLKPSKIRVDHQGANESEIGTVFFDSNQNTVSALLREWPAFHLAFLAELRAAGLVPPPAVDADSQRHR
jgi:hypothetical protein